MLNVPSPYIHVRFCKEGYQNKLTVATMPNNIGNLSLNCADDIVKVETLFVKPRMLKSLAIFMVKHICL